MRGLHGLLSSDWLQGRRISIASLCENISAQLAEKWTSTLILLVIQVWELRLQANRSAGKLISVPWKQHFARRRPSTNNMLTIEETGLCRKHIR